MATDSQTSPVSRPARSLAGIRLLLAVGTLCLLYYHLGTMALTESSEARYGSIARTMLDTGDWMTPVLNGLPHFSKPPFAYWASALGMKICGISEFGARFLLPIAGLLTVLGCFEIGLLLGNLRLALCSSLSLVTSLMFLILFRGLTADPWLTAWETWMVWALLAHDRKPESRYAVFFWLFAGLGMLTKGFPALLPLLGLLPVLALRDFTGKWKSLLLNRLGILIFIIVGLGWYLAVAFSNPQLFRYFLVHETFQRVASTVHERAKPWHFFFWLIPLSIFPWSTFFIAGLARLFSREDPQRSEPRALLPWWIGIPFIVFTLSQSKMATYALPLLVPVALVVGDFLSRIISPASDEPFSFKLETAFTLILFGVISITLVFLAMGDFIPNLKVARVAIFIALHLLFIMSFGYAFMYLGLARGVVMALAVAMPGFVFFALPALEGHEEIMTGKHLPTYRNLLQETARLAGDNPVLCVEDLLYGIPFYTGKSWPTWNVQREPSFNQALQTNFDRYGDQALQETAASDSWLYLIRDKDLGRVENISRRKAVLKYRQANWGVYALQQRLISEEPVVETGTAAASTGSTDLSVASATIHLIPAANGSAAHALLPATSSMATPSTDLYNEPLPTLASSARVDTGTVQTGTAPTSAASPGRLLPAIASEAASQATGATAPSAVSTNTAVVKPLPMLPAKAVIDTLPSPGTATKQAPTTASGPAKPPAGKPAAKPPTKPQPPKKNP